MKHAYRSAWPLLAALFLFIGLSASAQQAWRPFRPGLIYSYKESSGATSNLMHTLRVDSAYVTVGGDSVYAFNRLLRTSTIPSRWLVKSRDNLFGALLRWRPGQASYTLEALAQTDVQAGVSLELFPRAAVGSTWNASSQPLRTATLVNRSWQTVSPGVQDSVVVINITGSMASTVRLSRRYGLLEGPQWLGGATGNPMEQALLPASFEQSLYSPLRLFDVQPGDEFGYYRDDFVVAVSCVDDKILRRVTNRRLTADSLIITYQEQSRHEQFGYQGICGGSPQINYSPITLKRWALARAGNQWQPTGTAIPLGALRLLTGEYVNSPVPGSGPVTSQSYLFVGLPIAITGVSNCSAGSEVSFVPFYPQNGSAYYMRGVDYFAWGYSFGPGTALTFERDYGLSYSRKTVNGVVQICGRPQGFVSLLPTRAAQASTIATLHPNPAAEAAMLTLAAPARPGTTLRLTDALGRPVWASPVAVGQTTVAVPLAGQPAGLYLLHLQGRETAASWKLMHE